jgi:hypothetical protein
MNDAERIAETGRFDSKDVIDAARRWRKMQQLGEQTDCCWFRCFCALSKELLLDPTNVSIRAKLKLMVDGVEAGLAGEASPIGFQELVQPFQTPIPD